LQWNNRTANLDERERDRVIDQIVKYLGVL